MKKILKPLLASLASLSAFGLSQAHAEDLGAIWMIGDSITQSNADGNSGSSPRLSLYNLLTDAGHTFTYTGHHTSNVDGLPTTGSSTSTNLYQYHSGVSGIRIGEIGEDPGVTPNLSSYWQTGRLNSVKPDIILIMIGTNDAGSSSYVENTPDRLEAMLDTIYGLSGVGSPTIYIASIPPNGRNTTYANNVFEFNASIPAIVYDFQTEGKDIHYVDTFASLNEDFDTYMSTDLLHPNTAGNDAIGQNWFDAMTGGVTVTGVKATNASAYSSSISSTDLVNAKSYNLESGPTYSASPNYGTAANNDGTAGTNDGTDGITFWLNSAAGKTYSISYALDTSANTAGYDITSLQTIHGWNKNSGNQKNQNYTVAVSTVNDSEFKTIATVAYLPLSSADTSASTKVTVTNDDTGVLATNVEKIRFTYTVPGTGGSQPSPTIQEIDVFGTPSTAVSSTVRLVQIRKRNAASYVLDGSNGGSEGQNIGIYRYINGHPNLTWEEIDRGNGYYSYQKYATSYSISGGSGGSRYQNVYMTRTDASDYNQQWKKVSMGNGHYQLQKRSNLDYAIDGGNGGANRQNVNLWPSASGSFNLQWTFEYK